MLNILYLHKHINWVRINVLMSHLLNIFSSWLGEKIQFSSYFLFLFYFYWHKKPLETLHMHINNIVNEDFPLIKWSLQFSQQAKNTPPTEISLPQQPFVCECFVFNLLTVVSTILIMQQWYLWSLPHWTHRYKNAIKFNNTLSIWNALFLGVWLCSLHCVNWIRKTFF